MQQKLRNAEEPEIEHAAALLFTLLQRGDAEATCDVLAYPFLNEIVEIKDRDQWVAELYVDYKQIQPAISVDARNVRGSTAEVHIFYSYVRTYEESTPPEGRRQGEVACAIRTYDLHKLGREWRVAAIRRLEYVDC